jgi:hypothetical protein
MAISKRQVSFFIETDLWKLFSKKCIDIDKSKTEVLKGLIKHFVESKKE